MLGLVSSMKTFLGGLLTTWPGRYYGYGDQRQILAREELEETP
jgi:hypothetical protein